MEKKERFVACVFRCCYQVLKKKKIIDLHHIDQDHHLHKRHEHEQRAAITPWAWWCWKCCLQPFVAFSCVKLLFYFFLLFSSIFEFQSLFSYTRYRNCVTTFVFLIFTKICFINNLQIEMLFEKKKVRILALGNW